MSDDKTFSVLKGRDASQAQRHLLRTATGKAVDKAGTSYKKPTLPKLSFLSDKKDRE